MLEARNLSLERGCRLLFDDLSFQLKAGDILHIQGDNGIGKTSLLRCIAGLAEPDSGAVISSLQAHQRLYIGHQAGVKANLTVTENLHFFAQLANCHQTDKLDAALNKLSLKAFADDLCAQLSSGQNRRVALSRLFFENKPLWCLDEPFTALDNKVTQVIANKIAEHSASGGIIILTSHQAVPIDSSKLTILALGETA